MEIHRLDDYQSWAIRTPDTTVVIDPWLTGECLLPGGKRSFAGPMSQDLCLPKSFWMKGWTG